MPDLQTIQASVGQAVPFNRLLGVQVTKVSADEVEVILPDKPEHQNHVGSVHAAAQFGLAEATSGTMVVVAFGKLLATGLTPLATQATIKYRAIAQGELKGVARLPEEEQTRIKEELAAKGKVRFTVGVQLLDALGKATTEMEVEWILLKRG